MEFYRGEERAGEGWAVDVAAVAEVTAVEITLVAVEDVGYPDGGFDARCLEYFELIGQFHVGIEYKKQSSSAFKQKILSSKSFLLSSHRTAFFHASFIIWATDFIIFTYIA